MGKVNDLLVADSEMYLSSFLAEKLPENIIYHNYDHLLAVKNYAETIGAQSGLTADEMNILRLSALFHHAGYVNSYERNNEESIKIAAAFLEEKKADRETIEQICGIIKSTKIPNNPEDKIAQVLCDADMMFMTMENAIEQFDLLVDETALAKPKYEKRSFFEKPWLDYFATHEYHTEYGKTTLQPKKEAAILRITERIRRRKLIENKKLPPAKKKIIYTRGVDTMFRVTARNQINLNSLADNKSNILISVNAIIISIIITMLAGKIGNMSEDIVPILVFLFICLVTIIIAILSTRPNLVTRKFSREDLSKKNVDLTFFGNFIKMNFDDYLNSVKDMMVDDDHLYASLLRNQYELGKILAKKFRLVKIAYNVFMIGIIITVIAFVLNYIIVH